MSDTKFTPLSELDSIPSEGCLLVGDTIYVYSDYEIDDSISVEGDTPEEKIANALDDIEVPEGTPVYVDDEDIFVENILDDTGKIQTADEAYEDMPEEEKDDADSFEEYCFNHDFDD